MSICMDEIEDDKEAHQRPCSPLLDGVDGDADDLFGIVWHPIFLVLSFVSWFCSDDFGTKF